MTPHSESRKEATLLLTPKATTLIGTWNFQSSTVVENKLLLLLLLLLYEAGKSAQIAAEMTAYNLSILGFCETTWIESGCIQLSTEQTVIYSGHEDANASQTEGV